MELTHKQKKLIKFCLDQIKHWENTNDIKSPTITSDINAEIDSLVYDDVINEVHARDLFTNLCGLLTTIRYIDD